jgi:hypothetical protein
MKKLTINRASKLLCLSKDVLKQGVKSGTLVMSDGCLDCDQLKCLYPEAFDRLENGKLDFYTALKETAGEWKNDAKEKMAVSMDKYQLVNQIRRLEAENYMLHKQINQLLEQIGSKQ